MIVGERVENDRNEADSNDDSAEYYGKNAPVTSRITAVLDNKPSSKIVRKRVQRGTESVGKDGCVCMYLVKLSFRYASISNLTAENTLG